MKENNSNAISRGQWLGIIGLMVVVSLVMSLLTAGITGQSIRVRSGQGVNDRLNWVGFYEGQKIWGTSDGGFLFKNKNNQDIVTLANNSGIGLKFSSNDEGNQATTQLSINGFSQNFILKDGRTLTTNLIGDNFVINKNEGNSITQTMMSAGSLLTSEDHNHLLVTSNYLQFCNAEGQCMWCYPDFVAKKLNCM